VLTIAEATIPRDGDIVCDLFAEYSKWLCRRLAQEYGAVVDAKSMLEHSLECMNAFLPPRGLLLLALAEGAAAGCVCIRTINTSIAELKQMYVRPGFRGKGIGTALLQEAIRKAQQLGYLAVRLDSSRFMSDAHRLYRSLGFREIIPYEGTDVPRERQTQCVFMQLDLVVGEGDAPRSCPA
jgi:GNAT superfamily N-acetyltransferase